MLSRTIRLIQILGLFFVSTQAFLPCGNHPRLSLASTTSIGSSTDDVVANEQVPSASEDETPSTPNTYVRCGKCQSVYAITAEDIGNSAGRRLECSLCGHSWFQSKERILTLNNDLEMVPLSQRELDRIEMNRQEGKPLGFVGDKKLYVGNVAFEAHEEDFFHVFSKFGIVGDVSLVRDETGKNRGFGFVTMRTEEGAKLAIEQGDKMSIRGREVAVRESNT